MEVHAFISAVIRRREKALVMNLNVHCVNLACRIDWLREFLDNAQLVFCDGDGVRWGVKLLGYAPPPKITYAQWMWDFALYCEQNGFSLYFIGAKPGVAGQAADRLKVKFPRLIFKGTSDGYFSKEGAENDRVIQEINELKPDILITGFGMPVQERWLKENWEKIDAHIFLTGGAVFDYLSGNLARAPEWMVHYQLEWLFRLFQEPKRLFTRYVVGNPLFFLRVLREKLTRRVHKK